MIGSTFLCIVNLHCTLQSYHRALGMNISDLSRHILLTNLSCISRWQLLPNMGFSLCFRERVTYYTVISMKRSWRCSGSNDAQVAAATNNLLSQTLEELWWMKATQSFQKSLWTSCADAQQRTVNLPCTFISFIRKDSIWQCPSERGGHICWTASI